MSISSIIDLAVILIVLVSAGVSFFRGFVREVLTIFGFIGGGLAAFMFGGKLAPVLEKWFGVEKGKPVEKLFDLVPYDIVATVCAYAGIFIAVFLILQLISYFMSASIRAIGLGPVDRSLGVVFGIARAVLLLGIFYAALGGLIPDDVRKDVAGKSKTLVYLEGVAGWVKGFFPEDADKKMKDKAEEVRDGQIESLKEKLQDSGEELKDKSLELKDRAQDKAEELKDKAGEGYSNTERKSLDNLIEQENEPERTPPNE